MSETQSLLVNTSPTDYTEAGIETISSRQPNIHDSTGSRSHEEENLEIKIKNGTSWQGCIFLVVNAALGAGLLNFPEAFHLSGGFSVAIPIQIILCLFVIASMYFLVLYSHHLSCVTYEDLMKRMIGPVWAYICSFCIIAYSFGSCVTYIIIVGDQWEKFLEAVYPSYQSTWYLNRRMCMVVTCTIFILPLCYARRIDFLKYASSVGVVAIIYCIGVITVRYFIGSNIIDYAPMRTRPDNWTDVFLIIPAICYAYQCHLSLVPIYACCNDQSPSKFSATIYISIFLCFAIYTICAIFGYLTFGSCVLPDILSSYSPSPDVLVAVICVALKMYTVYPLILFVGRGAMETFWIDLWKLSVAEAEVSEFKRRVVVTTVWFVASLILAIFVPDIEKVIALLGSFAALFIFVFPGLCLYFLTIGTTDSYSDNYIRRYSLIAKATAILFISIGVFIFGIIITRIIYEDVESYKPARPIQCL